ncbi:proteoglycan 4-like [Hermetia illucens]|uniref:proteoglycan 4-like n=1 Tax=Hermetia illucens TaxID=343691 RepID=UPI0018CC47EE|nr:proteoglycan 4-like [Hermetia illucens]
MKKSHGLSSDEDETSPERNTRGRHTTRRRHTDTDLDNNDPGHSRFSEVDNLNTSLTFPYVSHESARTTAPLEVDDAKECSSGLNSSPTFGQLKKLSNQPNKLDDSTDISPDNTEAFIGNIRPNPQIHVESADPKVKQLENSRKHRKRKYKKRTTRRSPGAATNTMRTYVNPNFLSRTVSEVCISSANLASDETNETSPLEALKQEENDSVNSQSSTTNSHFLRPKNPERRERSPAGSELESSEENRALGIRNQIQPCACSKCGKRLRPFEALGSSDNRENVQPPDHDTAYEVHQTQEYTRLIRGFFQSGLTKRSSSYNKHVEGPFLCDHDKHGDHRLHRGMHGRKCSCRSQSKKFRKPPAENNTKAPKLSSDESLERRRSQFRSGSREPMDASRKASADSNHRSSIDAKRASRCSCRVCKGRKDRALCNKNSNVEAWYGPRKVDSDREQYLSKTDTEKSLLRTGDAPRESKKLVNFSENSETSDPEEKVSRTCKCGLLNTTRKDSKTCSCAIPRPVLHRSDTSARVKPSTISKGSWMESRSNSAQIKPSKCSGITANNSYVKQEQIRGTPPNKCKCIKCRRRSEFVSPPPTSRTEDGGRRSSGQIKPSESSKVMVSVDVDTVQEQVKRAPPNKCKCAKCRGRSELSPPPVMEDVSRHSSGQTKPIKSSARITNVDGGTVQKQGTQTPPNKCRCAKCSRKSEFCQPPITSQVEDGSRHSRGQLRPSKVAEPTKNVYTDNTRTPSIKCNCNRCKQKSDTTQPLSKPPQDTPKGKECLCSSCGRKRRPSSEMPPSCTEESPPKPETEPKSSEEPKRQQSESSLPTPITSSLLAPIVPPPPTPAQLTSSDENEINRPSSTEFLDGVKPEPHTPNCICSICIDKSKCGITPPKKDEPVPVETKPFDRTQIPQHPSNPAVIEPTTSQSEEPCPCMQCENRRRDLKCETLDLVRTKSKSVIGLLQRPRIPSRVHTSIKPREEKGIHTYDCTCKICQEQDKHPIEEKKKKWRLPWSSAHPIELKPKPEPAQIKPWKVSEIFRHPRIPANPPKPREPSEVYLPPKIDDKCPCEKDRILTDKVETKHSSIADICRKPRLTPPIDQEPSFSRIFGDHAKDCKCKKCEDRAKCQIDVACHRPESVQTKSSGLLELLRHPRIPNAIDSEEKEVPVKTKSNPELISWKRERVDLQKSTSCPCVKCSDDKLPESKVHLKPVSIQSIIQHHPRIPQPIDNKRKSSRLESKEDKLRRRPSMESVDIKPIEHSPNCICQACTSQSNYEPEPSYDSSKVTTSSRRPEALCQRPRLPILMDFRPPKSVKPERDSCTCEREIITQSKIVTKRTTQAKPVNRLPHSQTQNLNSDTSKTKAL